MKDMQTKSVRSEDIQRAWDKGPVYCREKVGEFLHHAAVLMQSMQSLYMEDAGVMALLGVNVHCEITMLRATDKAECVFESCFGTQPVEQEAAHVAKKD